MAPLDTLETEEKNMDGEQNTVQPQVERDSGPGPLDVLEAQVTLRLANTHQQERDLLQTMQQVVERVQAGQQPVRSLPRLLQDLALELSSALTERRLLETLQRGGRL